MDDTVFLFDVDNTLIDNDRVQHDLDAHLGGAIRRSGADPVLGDFRRAVVRRSATPTISARSGAIGSRRCRIPACSGLANWLIDYPFAERLYSGALEAVSHARQWGRVVLLSDGDAVYQPRKVERSGLWSAFDGEVLIFVHKEKELDLVERLYPARRYVLIDDKLRILSAVKSVWGDRVTTVFPRQGRYAHDAKAVEAYPPPDVAIEAIRDIVALDRAAFAP